MFLVVYSIAVNQKSAIHMGKCINEAVLSEGIGAFTNEGTNDRKKLYTKSTPNKQCALDLIPTRVVKASCSILAPFLTYICNRSLTEGYLPPPQKAALVYPLLKKYNLDRCELKSYRPISILTFFIQKLIERVSSTQLTRYLERNLLLPQHQSAYRRGHSTETAFLKVYSDLTDAIDRGDVVLLGLLDMSADFDTVD